MDTATLLSTLRDRGVRLWVEGDRLQCSAPAGALDAETRETLASRKAEVLAFLRKAEALNSVRPPSCRSSRVGAGRRSLPCPATLATSFASSHWRVT